ncbi:MAG TPA: shikimate dehydrogenase [Allosphingosinicella sp.]|jgi:shikimate dehydrogenase
MGMPYAEVIGDPIAHSKSPLIHKFWLEKLAIKGDYRAVQVTPADLHVYLVDRARDPEWRGCNVTSPLKRAVLPFMAHVDREASRAGAVNVITPAPGGTRKGRNTDVLAVAELLRQFSRPSYKNHVATYVQIVGAGGAARAAATGAREAGYGDFDVFNRSIEHAHELAASIGAPFGKGNPLGALGPIRKLDDGPEDQRYSHVVINATPLGMSGQPPVPIDLSTYYPDTIVLDMVYSPVETPLIREARAFRLATIDGLQMLVAQAAHAFHSFFGQPSPRQYDAELRALLTR